MPAPILLSSTPYFFNDMPGVVWYLEPVMKKSRRNQHAITRAVLSFSLIPGRRPLAFPNFTTPGEAMRRDREAIAGDWEKVGGGIWAAAKVVMENKA